MRRCLSLTLLYAFICLNSVSSTGAAGEVKESEITVCAVDSDCIIVPYSHCCGLTKLAINRKYEPLYKSKPEWQKFDDPKACSTGGACATDRFKDSTICALSEGTKRCQLSSK